MSQTRICFNIERPNEANLRSQGRRGPFAPILMALETLTAINKWQLRQKDYPLLYKSGIYYKTKPPAVEWHDIPTLLKWGYGDCKDLVAYRVAELDHYFGIKTVPCIKWKFLNYKLYDEDGLPYNQPILLVHVMVMYPNGMIEDPSKILGMGGEYQ